MHGGGGQCWTQCTNPRNTAAARDSVAIISTSNRLRALAKLLGWIRADSGWQLDCVRRSESTRFRSTRCRLQPWPPQPSPSQDPGSTLPRLTTSAGFLASASQALFPIPLRLKFTSLCMNPEVEGGRRHKIREQQLSNLGSQAPNSGFDLVRCHRLGCKVEHTAHGGCSVVQGNT